MDEETGTQSDCITYPALHSLWVPGLSESQNITHKELGSPHSPSHQLCDRGQLSLISSSVKWEWKWLV